MKSAVWALVGLFFVAFATGCPEPRLVKGSPVEGGAAEGLAAESPPARPDVILLMVDTLRADRLGLYGYDRGTTPGIDRWAEDHATIYRDTLATGTWTLPSAASILTNLSVTPASPVTDGAPA